MRDKFKVGDKIRIIDANSLFNNHRFADGDVIEIKGIGVDGDLVTDTGSFIFTDELDCIELYQESNITPVNGVIQSLTIPIAEGLESQEMDLNASDGNTYSVRIERKYD